MASQEATQFRISSCHQASQVSWRLMSQEGDEARFKAVLGGWGQSVDASERMRDRLTSDSTASIQSQRA